MFDVVQKFINQPFCYIKITDNDLDYKIFKIGPTAFTELGIAGKEFTVVDCSQNYMEQSAILAVGASMKHSKTPGLVLSPDPKISADLIKYFPIFGLHGMISWNRDNIENQRRWTWSCLNRNPRPHRILNWLAIKDLPRGVTSMHNLYHSDISACGQELNDQWQNLAKTLPTECYNDLGISHPAYQHAMINVVTETDVANNIFISEKTWKPVASGQLFVIIGCQGTVAYLRSQGVDVFDDIIDHSYDQESNWQKRLYAMHQSFKSLLACDLDQIWNQTRARRQLNVDNFFAGKFFNNYLYEIF